MWLFLNVAIYPEDWEGSNNYLEGWNLLTVSVDYNVLHHIYEQRDIHQTHFMADP